MAELASMGYRTAGEADGASGVAAAIRLRPNAVLIDVGLPVMDGIEATRRIKEDPRTSACIVIVMTGNGMKKFEEARTAGCDAYFCKPFDPAALDGVLRTLSSPTEQSRGHVRPEMVKECTCGRRFSLNQWMNLAQSGRMHIPRRGVVVELRTCMCGSTLTVELDDLGVAIAPKAPPESARDEVGARIGTVLVVDRDPHIRRLLQRFLGEAYAIEFMDDGYSALDRVRASPPAVLITEILIPRLDGLALCRSLKGDLVTQQVPILVISMLAADERAHESGADAFLEKPLERTSLVAQVRGLIERTERKDALPRPDKGIS
jgi:two-component system response regulator MprA